MPPLPPNSALLVIDIQCGWYCAAPGPHDPAGTLARINDLIDRARAASGNRAPQLQPAPTARRETSIHDVQQLLIDSPAGMVLIQAGADNRIIGLVTLHDLLRAETAFDQGD